MLAIFMFTEEISGINFPTTAQTLKSFPFFFFPILPDMTIIFAKCAVGLFFTLKIAQEGHQLSYSSHMELSRSRLVVKRRNSHRGVFSRSLRFIILIFEVHSEYPV